MLTAIMAKAQDVYINGVFYNLNKEDKTASVTYRGSYINEYLGEVTIPLTITYDDIELLLSAKTSSLACTCMHAHASLEK